MRRWLSEASRRFTLSGELRQCSASKTDHDTLPPPRVSSKPGTESFGINKTKLDLALNLHEMDFDAVVKATREALKKEQMRGETSISDGVSIANLIPENKRVEVGAAAAEVQSSSPIPLFTSANSCGLNITESGVKDDHSAWKEHQTLRRVTAGSRDVYSEALSSYSGKEQRNTENIRYSLMDALRDCLLAGNWLKAMRSFENAVETSSKGLQNSSPLLAVAITPDVEKELFNTLHRINATTPPGSASATGNAVKRQGILRWNGGHFYLLLKLLLSKYRPVEAERVWDVMKRIGFVEYHMDAVTLNKCMGLARNTNSSEFVFPLSESSKPAEDSLKAFRRKFVLELEDWASKKKIVLGGCNKRMSQAAHIAEMVNKGSAEGKNQEGENVASLNGSGLKVGDFAGLLRRCTSEESTNRVLNMMDKLNVFRDGQIYSALIASLRQPLYRLTVTGETDNASKTKDEYDSYRRKRFERACQWFEECPEKERTVDVYNEILHISRGNKEADEVFHRILLEFRGAELSLPKVSTSTTDGVTEGGGEKNLNVKLIPHHWKVLPNGRTYEILISHCRYMREWEALWALYEELMDGRIKGTQRCYQILLEVAKHHPPQGRDPNVVVMELYEDMKGRGIDVTDVHNTMNIVNAWCSTRRRRRW